MKILVTGGAGLVGRTAVARLLRHDHEVCVVDRNPYEEVPEAVRAQIAGATYYQADITDFEQLRPCFAGMEAVVHLAAIPHPAQVPEVELFHINCTGAFNVYRAAADAGIRRVVSASSINALGYNYGIKSFPIRYFPIDEDHPTYTTDPYSFSKQVLEETAAYFWRREGISGVCLRLPGVFDPTSRWAGHARQFADRRQEAFDTVAALPEAERRARIDRLIAETNALRAERMSELPFEEQRRIFEARRQALKDGPPPPEMMLMFGRSDFWTLIHVEDAAQAIEKGVLADYEGSHPLFVCDRENSLGVPSRALATFFFPEVTTWKAEVPGATSLVSSARAAALIDFDPEISMNAWFAASEDAAQVPEVESA